VGFAAKIISEWDFDRVVGYARMVRLDVGTESLSSPSNPTRLKQSLHG
jgi:hypothetical protein